MERKEGALKVVIASEATKIVALHFLGEDWLGRQKLICLYPPLPPHLHPALLKVGEVLSWRNPFFHIFVDGQTGVRIEEDDLYDVALGNAGEEKGMEKLLREWITTSLDVNKEL
eukprot:m.70372 g.70372  ORF g.70372 m.70372 type:complete len:114 (-) comp20073_c0_seq2:123-464(-)